ncbi:MAG: flagellar biosynthetic protein FliR [Candidatus Azotimanducaceae bacterium]|jgi:flagellar biosynthetic protein FliR
MEDIMALSSMLDEYFWQGFIVFLRVAAVTSLLPGFGGQTVSVRIKLIIALAFTAIIAPSIEFPSFVSNVESLTRLMLVETLTGLLIGIGVRLFILALQTAGAIAAQSTSLSQLLGGAVAEPLAAIGYILTMGAIALAMIAGLHVKVASTVILSYQILPVGMFVTGSQVVEWGVNQISNAFQLAFVLSAPFVLVSILYNLALGAINKAMPQLMVAFVGAPVITFGGLFLLFVASPFLLTNWVKALDLFLAKPFGNF